MAKVEPTTTNDVVAAEDAITPEETRRQWAIDLLWRSWLFFFLLGLIVFFWLTTPAHTFPAGSNFKLIALNTSEVILLAIAETFIIVTAGIALSIGGILLFAGV